MDDAPAPPTADDRLDAVRAAVADVGRAELALQRAVDEARAAGDPEEGILAALAVRDAGVRRGVGELVEALGPAYVAAIAGARTKEHAAEWTAPGGPLPGPDQARRLRTAHQAWVRVTGARGADAARAWILRPNPLLAGDSPLVAIKRDRVRDLTPAVEAFLAG